MSQFRIGVDFGGTKTEVAALGPDGTALVRRRLPTPQGRYEAGVATIADLVRSVEQELGAEATVGIGIPGVISPATGLVKNANSICLNGHPVRPRYQRGARRARCGSRTTPIASRCRRRWMAPARGTAPCSASSSARDAAAG